jgi:hypothetical protein
MWVVQCPGGYVLLALHPRNLKTKKDPSDFKK